MFNSNKLKSFLLHFPPGLENLAIQIVKENLLSTEIIFSNEEYLALRTNSPSFHITLPYFETVYFIFKFYKDQNHNLDFLLEDSLKLPNLEQNLKAVKSEKNVSYRIVESKPNYKNKNKYRALVNKIETKLKTRGVHIDRTNPDFDIRIAEEETFGFVGIRISEPPEYISKFQTGSIRKEVASCMIYLSQPKPTDIFCDPFCGGGIIPILRSQMFKYKEIFASDKDTSNLKNKLDNLNFNINHLQILNSPIQALQHKLNLKVNKIVTDPPWGNLDKNINVKSLYQNMFKTFKAISSSNSIIVVTSPHKKIITNLVNSTNSLEIKDEIKTFASGRKTFIYKILFIK